MFAPTQANYFGLAYSNSNKAWHQSQEFVSGILALSQIISSPAFNALPSGAKHLYQYAFEHSDHCFKTVTLTLDTLVDHHSPVLQTKGNESGTAIEKATRTIKRWLKSILNAQEGIFNQGNLWQNLRQFLFIERHPTKKGTYFFHFRRFTQADLQAIKFRVKANKKPKLQKQLSLDDCNKQFYLKEVSSSSPMKPIDGFEEAKGLGEQEFLSDEAVNVFINFHSFGSGEDLSAGRTISHTQDFFWAEDANDCKKLANDCKKLANDCQNGGSEKPLTASPEAGFQEAPISPTVLKLNSNIQHQQVENHSTPSVSVDDEFWQKVKSAIFRLLPDWNPRADWLLQKTWARVSGLADKNLGEYLVLARNHWMDSEEVKGRYREKIGETWIDKRAKLWHSLLQDFCENPQEIARKWPLNGCFARKIRDEKQRKVERNFLKRQAERLEKSKMTIENEQKNSEKQSKETVAGGTFMESFWQKQRGKAPVEALKEQVSPNGDTCLENPFANAYLTRLGAVG